MSYEKVLERSPMRAFDRSIHGVPSEGGLGVVAGRAGVGKSAFIVHIALDHLLRGDRVLHISLREEAESVRNFYNEIFDALSRVARLVGRERDRAHLQVEQGRQIQCYLERAFSVDDLEKALAFTAEVMHFTPAVVILDGYDPKDVAELERLSALGQARGFSVWASVRTHRDEDGAVPHEDGWQTVVVLEPVDTSIELKAHKVDGKVVNEPMGLTLEPSTMLVTGEATWDPLSAPPAPAPRTAPSTPAAPPGRRPPSARPPRPSGSPR